MEDHCTFVNALCPSDLCVLPYGHLFTSRNRHLTGTMYGSGDDTMEERVMRLRNPNTAWSREVTRMAPKGTSVEQLITLGCELQDDIDDDIDDKGRKA